MSWEDSGTGTWMWIASGNDYEVQGDPPPNPPPSAKLAAAAGTPASQPQAQPLTAPATPHPFGARIASGPSTAAQDAAALSSLTAPTQAPAPPAGGLDYSTWNQKKLQLDAQAASDPAWKASPSGYAASLAALGPQPRDVPVAAPAQPSAGQVVAPVDTSSTSPFAPGQAAITSLPARAPLTSTIPLAGIQGPGHIAPQATSLASQFASQVQYPTANPFVAQPSGAQTAAADAPKIDTSKADAALAGVNSYGAQIASLAGTEVGNRAALAQLASSNQQAQSAALGQARSGSIRDRAALERGAVGEVAFTQQQGGRDAAQLAATQEEADRQFKLQTLSKAADLGLNTSALEVDISKANLDSASNYINQQFQQLGINKQVSAQEAGQILQFTRDMAAVQEQYASLDEASKSAFLQAETQRYGIDQDTATKLAQIAEQHGENKTATGWGSFFKNVTAGAIAGFTGAASQAILPKPK